MVDAGAAKAKRQRAKIGSNNEEEVQKGKEGGGKRRGGEEEKVVKRGKDKIK